MLFIAKTIDIEVFFSYLFSRSVSQFLWNPHESIQDQLSVETCLHYFQSSIWTNGKYRRYFLFQWDQLSMLLSIHFFRTRAVCSLIPKCGTIWWSMFYMKWQSMSVNDILMSEHQLNFFPLLYPLPFLFRGKVRAWNRQRYPANWSPKYEDCSSICADRSTISS